MRHPSKAGEVVTPYYEDGSVTIRKGDRTFVYMEVWP